MMRLFAGPDPRIAGSVSLDEPQIVMIEYNRWAK
jgi:hypothetical protein